MIEIIVFEVLGLINMVMAYIVMNDDETPFIQMMAAAMCFMVIFVKLGVV